MDNSKRFPTFYNNDDISGVITIILKSKTFSHKGVRVELHGEIEQHTTIPKKFTFLLQTNQILHPGEISQEITKANFIFHNTELKYESYKGDYATIKYFIRVVIAGTKNANYDQEFAVVNPLPDDILKKNDEPIEMNVGIKNLMGLEIKFEHKNLSCRGVLKGTVIFKLIKIPFVYMEIQIVRREVVNDIKDSCEPAYVAKYELIDGTPIMNINVPIRLFLKTYNLTPSYPNVENKMSVKYFLNIVIVDASDNRYFKQKEICLFRIKRNKNKKDKNKEEFITASMSEEEYSGYENKNAIIDDNEMEMNENDGEEYVSNISNYINKDNEKNIINNGDIYSNIRSNIYHDVINVKTEKSNKQENIKLNKERLRSKSISFNTNINNCDFNNKNDNNLNNNKNINSINNYNTDNNNKDANNNKSNYKNNNSNRKYSFNNSSNNSINDNYNNSNYYSNYNSHNYSLKNNNRNYNFNNDILDINNLYSNIYSNYNPISNDNGPFNNNIRKSEGNIGEKFYNISTLGRRFSNLFGFSKSSNKKENKEEKTNKNNITNKEDKSIKEPQNIKEDPSNKNNIITTNFPTKEYYKQYNNNNDNNIL